MKKITIGIEGMSCVACSNSIEKYLNKQKGIISANVNLVMANATIEYDEQILNQRQIDVFIKNCGYKSTDIYKLKDEGKKNKKSKDLTNYFWCFNSDFTLYFNGYDDWLATSRFSKYAQT